MEQVDIRTFVARMKRRWVGSRTAQCELDKLLIDFERRHDNATTEATRLTESDWLVHATISRWRADDDA